MLGAYYTGQIYMGLSGLFGGGVDVVRWIEQAVEATGTFSTASVTSPGAFIESTAPTAESFTASTNPTPGSWSPQPDPEDSNWSEEV